MEVVEGFLRDLRAAATVAGVNHATAPIAMTLSAMTPAWRILATSPAISLIRACGNSVPDWLWIVTQPMNVGFLVAGDIGAFGRNDVVGCVPIEAAGDVGEFG